MVNIEREWLFRMEKLERYNEWLFSHIKDYLGDRVWEIGAGIGTYSKYMLEVKLLVVSDIVDDYLSSLKIKFKDSNNIIVEKVDLLNDDYRELEGYNIDTVVCVNVLEHVDNDLKAMENIYKVLKNNGRFIFIGPNHRFLYGSLDVYAHHFRRYAKKELERSLSTIGFRIEKIFIFNFLAALTWFIQSRIAKKTIITSNNLNFYERFLPIAKFIDAVNPFPVGANIISIAKK